MSLIMKITILSTESDGTKSFEIRTKEISFGALLRCIRKIPGATVSGSAFDAMNDNAKGMVKYKDIELSIEAPFSDYIINCQSTSDSFEEFMGILESYSVKWWERFF